MFPCFQTRWSDEIKGNAAGSDLPRFFLMLWYRAKMALSRACTSTKPNSPLKLYWIQPTKQYRWNHTLSCRRIIGWETLTLKTALVKPWMRMKTTLNKSLIFIWSRTKLSTSYSIYAQIVSSRLMLYWLKNDPECGEEKLFKAQNLKCSWNVHLMFCIKTNQQPSDIIYHEFQVYNRTQTVIITRGWHAAFWSTGPTDQHPPDCILGTVLPVLVRCREWT